MHETAHVAEPARLVVEVDPPSPSHLAEDVARGLLLPQKSLPPKYFYDDRGSSLFDGICDTPEYYQTRTEDALLARVAPALVAAVRPTHLVELGSGACRKTRRLLEAMEDRRPQGIYVPLDVSEGMLRASASGLVSDFPWLQVHGLVGDYTRTIGRIPAGARRLVAFLGGTIGNYAHLEAVRFLTTVRRALHPGDALLLGADLVKDPRVLNAAYNDDAGLTAAFNLNLLRILNRELGADFDPATFEHLAFYDADRRQIEMHLRSTRDQVIRFRALELAVPFREGETLHTEISRKFDEPALEALLTEAGFRLSEVHLPTDRYFALALAEPE